MKFSQYTWNLYKQKNMRLIDIKKSINIAWDNIQPITVEEFSDNIRINNTDKLKIVLDELMDIKFIQQNDSSIYPIVVASSSKSILFDKSKHKNISLAITELQKSIYLTNRWINGYVPSEQDEETVNIKLPQINNFDVLNKVANELRLAFSTVISEYDGGKIEIVQFDHGSFWCVIKVGTALLLFTGLAWAGAVVAKKTIECKSAYEVYRNASARNEMLEELIRLNKVQIDTVIEQEAKLIQQEHFSKEDNEQLERIKNSILNISELILKGTDIQPAIAAPEDVKNLFPDFNCLPLIESRTKKLTENASSNTQ